MPIKKIRLSVNERCKDRELQSSPGASEARKEAASCDPGEVPGISTGGPQGPCRQKAAHLPTDSIPFQFHSPPSTCTSTCDKPWAGAHWGSSQSLELAQPSSQHPTVICTRSGTSWPISRDPPSYKSARRPLRFAGNVGVFNEDSDTGVICTGEQASLCGTK